MMKLVLALVATLIATPAFAAWELDSSDSKKSWFYAAYETDKTGEIELQFYCDRVQRSAITALIFTGEDAAVGDGDVSVSANVGNMGFSDMVGYYDDVDGERVVVLSSLDDIRLLSFIGMLSQAKQPIRVSYGDSEYRFGIQDAQPTITSFLAACKR